MCGSAVGSFKEDLDGELVGEVGDFAEVAMKEVKRGSHMLLGSSSPVGDLAVWA